MTFEVVESNIVNVPADAIVLPANSELKEGSGASAAIFAAAGRRQLTQACRKIGSCGVGSAVPTLAYKLNAKYIIHAVVSRWIDGNHGEYDLLSSAYLSALKVADIMECESIAFPLLASGNNGYDIELAFRIAQESIESFSGTSLKKVILVLFGYRAVAVAKELGYDAAVIPVDLHAEEIKQANNEKVWKLFSDSKEIAQKILERGMQKAKDWISDEKNIDMLLDYGVALAKKACDKSKEEKEKEK